MSDGGNGYVWGRTQRGIERGGGPEQDLLREGWGAAVLQRGSHTYEDATLLSLVKDRPAVSANKSRSIEPGGAATSSTLRWDGHKYTPQGL